MGLFHVLGYQLSGESVLGAEQGGGGVEGGVSLTGVRQEQCSLTQCRALFQTFSQKFVGHSGAISQLVVSPDGRRLVSCGEALFVWEVLSARSFSPLPPSRPALLPKSASPRRKAPVPTSYEPVHAHSFTPIIGRKPVTANNGSTCSSSSSSSSNSSEADSPNDSPDRANDGRRGASLSKEVDIGSEMRNSPPQGGDEEESIVTSEEIIIDHAPQGGVQLTVKSRGRGEPSSMSLPAPPIFGAQKHYKYVPPAFSKPGELYMAPPDHAGMRLRRVIGCSGRGRNNIVWAATTGKFVKAKGNRGKGM